MEANLKDKTGKDLEEWKTILAGKSFEKHGEIMKYLKGEHGISHGFANFITLKFREADAASHAGGDLLTAQYQGKEALMPIYEKLKAAITALGDDVEVAAKKAAVSFRRKRQFALVQPTTKTRIDLGLKFNDRRHGGRLEPSGHFGSMCTHRVQLTSPDQVDDEILEAIRAAYLEAA